MKKSVIFYLWVCTFLVQHFETEAQILKPNPMSSHNIQFNTGFDNSLVALNIGYAYYLPTYKSAAFVSITQGSSFLGTGNIRTDIGVQTWQGSFNKFTLKNQIAFVYARNVNASGRYEGLGVNFTLNAGFQFNRFGFGLDGQYNPFFATFVEHSDLYRQEYYANAQDGWYQSTAQNKRLGVYLARQFGEEKKLEINLKLGVQNNGIYDKLIPNFYAIVGINKSF